MTSSKYDTDTKPAKPSTKLVMPAGGTIVSAARDYSVLSATKNTKDLTVPVAFLPAMPVVAWSIGADGAAFPVTAAPVDSTAVATGTLQVDGRVLGDDGVLYAGALEWQAAVKAADEAVMAEAASAKAKADEKAAKADAKANAKAETAAA